MDCLDAYALIKLAGKLHARERDREVVDSLKHLADCEKCRADLQNLQVALDELMELVRYDGAFAS